VEPSSGTEPSVLKASTAAVWAIASMISTPGITGLCGKWPGKKGSLMVTFLRPTMRLPISSSTIRSTSRKG
jgi:hypothetical protein